MKRFAGTIQDIHHKSSVVSFCLSFYGRVKGTKTDRDYPGDVVNQFFIP